MKFIVSSSSLLKQLQAIGGVLSTTNTLPILDDFLFEIKGNEVTISASDLETTMTTTLALEKAETDGSVAIPARLLLDTLKTFPEQPLTFSIDDKTFGVEISSENGKYKLAGQDGKEFPKVPEIESPSAVEIDADALFSAIDMTIFATGNDDLRPVMSGIYLELNEDSSRFVATDAHKLVRYTRTNAGADKVATLILPKKPMGIMKNLLPEVEGNVKIEYSENNAHFDMGEISIICRLQEGKYPNYDAVIPKENPNKLTIDRTTFLNSVKRVSIFSNKTTHQVRLKLAGSELNISAEDVDFSNEASERLTCNYEGEDIEIGFNSRFLVEMLSNLKSENVQLEMSQPNRAGILTPVETDDEHEDILMLVMPVMLND